MRRFTSFGPAFVVLTCFGVVLFAVPGAIRSINAASTRARVVLAQQALDGDDFLVRLNRAVREVASAVEPSVVHIEVSVSSEGPRSFRSSSGSGWVWDDAGHIVTNAHVVAGASDVRVQFHDGTSAKAEVVGSDIQSDIAVLRAERAGELVPVRRATSERLAQGDRVFAFGSPFGFKFSMSEGIVSGLGRSARTAMGFAGLSNYIQTDAAVNPGNSGGPLVDVRGRLVGMNVAIATAADTRGSVEGQSAGISFAIPLAMIESRVPQLISGGPVRAGYLGIRFGGANRFETSPMGGVSVSEVEPGGPAHTAGLRPGDVIVAIDDTTVNGSEVLRGIIASHQPGDTVKLRVQRESQTVEITVTLGEFPREARRVELQNELLSEYGVLLGDTTSGPVISRVITNMPADEDGLTTGMRLLSIEGTVYADADAAATELLRLGLLTGKPVRVSVRVGEESKDLTLKLNSP